MLGFADDVDIALGFRIGFEVWEAEGPDVAAPVVAVPPGEDAPEIETPRARAGAESDRRTGDGLAEGRTLGEGDRMGFLLIGVPTPPTPPNDIFFR